ncbi:dynamin family protein [Streptomyces sp. NPDC101112]|uniref:dynamin family protein n=1 Tax=Streptomyces sp. NPDC101112 TaxID=3366105 RepID=UPI003803AD0A
MTDTFEQLREDVTGLCQDLLGRVDDTVAPHTAERLDEVLRRLIDGRLTVVICGEFNRGKSTLLNVLLDQSTDLFPTAPYPKTRLVTTVEWGETEEYHVRVTRDDGSVEERRITREEIDDYAGETAHGLGQEHTDATVTVHLRLPNPRLCSGLVLMDTPGVGGTFPAHSRITHAALRLADAIVFVADVTDPLTKPELTFLATAGTALRAADSEDALLVVLNMIDQRPNYHAFADEMRRRVAERLGRTPAATPVHPVSALGKLHYLCTGDPAFLEESGLPAFEDALWRTLAARRIRVLLGAPLQEARAAAEALLAPLVAQETALRDTTGRELERLAAEAAAQRDRLDQLSEQSAGWREQAAARLEELHGEMKRRVTEAFDSIWQRASTELCAQEYYLTQPEHLDEQVNNECLLAMGSVDEWGARQATGIVQALAAESGLALAAPAFVGSARSSVVDLPSYRRLRPKKKKVYHAGPQRTEVIGAHWEDGSGNRAGVIRSGAAGLARTFSAAMGEKVGRALNVRYVQETRTVRGPGHTTVEIRNIPRSRLAARRAQLQSDLLRLRPLAQQVVTSELDTRVAEFAKAVTAEMESLIDRERESLDITLPLLEEARRATREEALATLGTLADAQQPLRTARQAAERLLEETEALAREAHAPHSRDSTPGDRDDGAGNNASGAPADGEEE